jgi:small subunit ribosomal protein S8
MQTDPIADFLTRIRNGLKARAKTVTIPHSRMKETLALLLAEEGYLEGQRVVRSGPRPLLEVDLKYGARGESVIRGLKRVSTPGRRVYSPIGRLAPLRSGQGTRLISTSKGVMTDSAAREQKVGGEVICEIW